MRQLVCLRCNKTMEYVGREKLQMGETGLLFGTLPNLIAGSLEVDLYLCPECGKLEFYAPMPTKGENQGYCHGDLPQKRCPNCGEMHDFDFPKCPYCKFDYYD